MENPTKYAGLAISAVVVILVAAAVVLPILAGSEHDMKTSNYVNEGTGSFAEVDLTDDVTITVTGSGFSLNGEAVSIDADYKYIYADTFRASTGVTNGVVNVIDFVNETYISYVTSIEISDGTATITRNQSGTISTSTVACSWLVISDSSGDLTYCADGAYTDGDFYATYPAGVAWTTLAFVITAADGELSTVNGANVANGVVTDISENVTGAVTKNGDYYTATVEYSDETYTLGILAPKSLSIYHADASSMTITLVAILPVLIMVGVLLFVVNAFVANRRA